MTVDFPLVILSLLELDCMGLFKAELVISEGSGEDSVVDPLLISVVTTVVAGLVRLEVTVCLFAEIVKPVVSNEVVLGIGCSVDRPSDVESVVAVIDVL